MEDREAAYKVHEQRARVSWFIYAVSVGITNWHRNKSPNIDGRDLSPLDLFVGSRDDKLQDPGSMIRSRR